MNAAEGELFTSFTLTLLTWVLEWQLVEVVSDSYHAMGHCDSSLDGMYKRRVYLKTLAIA